MKVITYREPNNATTSTNQTDIEWTLGSNVPDVAFCHKLDPHELKNGYVATNVIYNRGVEAVINMTSSICYGYWVSLIDESGNVIRSACIKTYPTWMNDMYKTIQNFQIRDLFIPGTHDSASYKNDYRVTKNESLVDKYAITQVTKCLIVHDIESIVTFIFF